MQSSGRSGNRLTSPTLPLRPLVLHLRLLPRHQLGVGLSGWSRSSPIRTWWWTDLKAILYGIDGMCVVEVRNARGSCG